MSRDRLRSTLVGTTALAGSLLGTSGEALAAVLKEPVASAFSLAAGAGALLAASAGIAFMALPGLRSWVVPPPKETALSDILQFDAVLSDGATIRTRDGQLVQTIRLRGIDYGSRSEDERSALYTKRHAWLMGLCHEGAVVKVVSIRERVSASADARYENPLLQSIHDRWQGEFASVYANRHYLTISVGEGRDGVKRLAELVQTIRDGLHDYGPEVLTNGEGKYSPLLSFWAHMVNGFPVQVAPHTKDISDRLPVAHVHFGRVSGLIEYQDGGKIRYATALSVRTWGDDDSGELVRRILALPGEVQLLQMLRCIRPERSKVRLPMRKMRQNFPLWSAIRSEEFEAAAELVNAGEASEIEYQFTVFVQADGLDALEELTTQAKRVFTDQQVRAVVETMAAEWLWRCRLPGFHTMTRKRFLLSENVASLVRFDEEPTGLDHSDWGEGPLRLFKTAAGSAYSLNLHASASKEALAHSVTFAPAGAGKTTLWEFLIGGALRHPDLAVYAFDRFQGMRIFTEAAGGKYIDLTNPDDVTFNPLQLPDTSENRRFLVDWLLQLAGVDDVDSMEAAKRAVQQIYTVRRTAARSLNSVSESAFDTGTTFRAQMRPWLGMEGYAAWFNGERDTLALEGARLTGFEMSTALNNPQAAAALVSYIMHRIRSMCRADARPHLVFIDETAPLLEDAMFAKSVEVMFREHRKLRGSINVVFQDVGALLKSSVAETVFNMAPTQFIFPNPNARQEDYAALGLSTTQWEYVKGTSRLARSLPRSVLVKRGPEAVILDVDLSPLGPQLKLLRSGSEAVKEWTSQLKKGWGIERCIEEYIEL